MELIIRSQYILCMSVVNPGRFVAFVLVLFSIEFDLFSFLSRSCKAT